jgi:hypothetical protein
VIAASSCCLPVLPFLFAAGAAGTLDLLHSTYNILIDVTTGALYIVVHYSVLLMKSQH